MSFIMRSFESVLLVDILLRGSQFGCEVELRLMVLVTEYRVV
jgi:hypothetical protein